MPIYLIAIELPINVNMEKFGKGTYFDTNLLVTSLIQLAENKKELTTEITNLLKEHKDLIKPHISTLTVAEIIEVLRTDSKFGKYHFEEDENLKRISGLISKLIGVMNIKIIEDGIKINNDVIKFVHKHPEVIDCLHVILAKQNELTFITEEAERIGRLKIFYSKIMSYDKLKRQYQ